MRPHGARELAQPEPGFYFAGMKSYGRAPTFLMMTGYEQVRSIVADIAGDKEAAERVELVLPETGVCSRPVTATVRQAKAVAADLRRWTADACCKQDADAKGAGAKDVGLTRAARSRHEGDFAGRKTGLRCPPRAQRLGWLVSHSALVGSNQAAEVVEIVGDAAVGGKS